jgi:hypothetical protein
MTRSRAAPRPTPGRRPRPTRAGISPRPPAVTSPSLRSILAYAVILGHASAAMTMDLYGHPIDQNLCDAAAKFGGTLGTWGRG